MDLWRKDAEQEMPTVNPFAKIQSGANSPRRNWRNLINIFIDIFTHFPPGELKIPRIDVQNIEKLVEQELWSVLMDTWPIIMEVSYSSCSCSIATLHQMQTLEWFPGDLNIRFCSIFCIEHTHSGFGCFAHLLHRVDMFLQNSFHSLIPFVLSYVWCPHWDTHGGQRLLSWSTNNLEMDTGTFLDLLFGAHTIIFCGWGKQRSPSSLPSIPFPLLLYYYQMPQKTVVVSAGPIFVQGCATPLSSG